MADQITDNRTQINAADTATNFVDLSGSSAGTQDTEIFYEGSASIGQYVTSSIDGLMYDITTPTDYSGNTFYFLINCGIVGLLATKAAGGLRIRFTGATVTDWFEVYAAGSDSWPASFAGGWTLFVVDVDVARATAITNGTTNGTPPATTAIQRYGYAAITGGTMPRMVDNTWLDAIYSLPANTPAIIVEGRNAGTTDWNWENVVTQMQAVASPVARFSDGGGIALSGPVQFGINDTSTHGFTDTNRAILWDNQEFIDDTLYRLSALGNVGGTTNVVFGSKTGTGTAAIGSQGLTIAAAGTGARYDLDFNDPNLDLVGLYGCSLQHGRNLLLDENTVETISSLLIDFSSCTLSTASTTTGVFQRNSIINANTLAATSFVIVESMNTIRDCSFQASAGYAIELNSNAGSPQSSINNTFSGYGADDTDNSAIHYTPLAGNDLTINISGGTIPTVDDRTAGTVTTANTVTSTITVQDGATNPIQNAVVAVYQTADDIQVFNGLTSVGGQASFSSDAGVAVYIRVRKSTTGSTRYIPVETVGTTGLTLTVTLTEDTVVSA